MIGNISTTVIAGNSQTPSIADQSTGKGIGDLDSSNGKDLLQFLAYLNHALGGSPSSNTFLNQLHLNDQDPLTKAIKEKLGKLLEGDQQDNNLSPDAVLALLGQLQVSLQKILPSIPQDQQAAFQKGIDAIGSLIQDLQKEYPTTGNLPNLEDSSKLNNIQQGTGKKCDPDKKTDNSTNNQTSNQQTIPSQPVIQAEISENNVANENSVAGNSSSQNTQGSVNSQNNSVSAQEKAIATIQSLLNNMPPEAQQALKETLAKLDDTLSTSKTLDKNLGKSPWQVQLEAALGQNQSQNQVMDISGTAFSSTDHQKQNSDDFSSQDQFASIVLNHLDHTQGSSATGQSIIANNVNLSGGNQNTITPPHDQVIDAIQANFSAGKKEITIQLKPDSLGDVRLTLSSNLQNEVSARLITTTQEAKNSLEKHIDQLVRTLDASGVRVGKITIVQAGQGSPDAQNNGFGQSTHQQGFFQNFSQSPYHQNSGHLAGFGSQHSFKDGGSFLSGTEASSNLSFDTDVGGEEVLSTTGSSDQSLTVGAVDIRI